MAGVVVGLKFEPYSDDDVKWMEAKGRKQVRKATDQVRSEWKIEEGEERETCLGGIGCHRRDQEPNFLWGEVQGTRQGIIQSLV